jgi:hypothetical protein
VRKGTKAGRMIKAGNQMVLLSQFIIAPTAMVEI